jgi:hypothetical protein
MKFKVNKQVLIGENIDREKTKECFEVGVLVKYSNSANLEKMCKFELRCEGLV